MQISKRYYNPIKIELASRYYYFLCVLFSIVTSAYLDIKFLILSLLYSLLRKKKEADR